MRLVSHAAVPTAFLLSVAATLAWAWTGGVDQLGLSAGTAGDPTVVMPAFDRPAPTLPRALPRLSSPSPSPTPSPTRTPTRVAVAPRVAAPSTEAVRVDRRCRLGRRLVPTCGILWGATPGAHTSKRGARALAEFERKTGRTQAIYHAYHGGIRQLFPTAEEIAIARQPGRHRILLLNWKPESVSWARIARGDRKTDAFLDRLAAHVKRTFPERFFLAVHHEGENEVRPKHGSGYTARDYAAMYRHVIQRLRAHGVTNMVTVLVHMAYVPHAKKSWFNDMYPGDDVVDWLGFDTYAYSDPGYGHGNFAQVFNRRDGKWPGFYTWAVTRHPGKPLMLAEWGVWTSRRNTAYKAAFYRNLATQLRPFPKIKALVQFETPRNQKGQDSSVDSSRAALTAYRNLGRLPLFQVAVTQ